MRNQIWILMICLFSLLAADEVRDAIRHNFQCSKCGIFVKSGHMPSSQGCQAAKYHQWLDLGEVGENTYQCKKCGKTLRSKSLPRSQGCQAAKYHDWVKLNR